MELLHTQCDGTKKKTAVLPAVLPTKADETARKSLPLFLRHSTFRPFRSTRRCDSSSRSSDWCARGGRTRGWVRSAPPGARGLSAYIGLRLCCYRRSPLPSQPGEAQQIDRIMQHFAEKYYEAHPDKFRVADTAYVLAFSLIMVCHGPSEWDFRQRLDAATVAHAAAHGC